jgi:hypothetical protein
VDDKIIQNRLSNALNKAKPFRNFKFEIDNSGKYRQEWFDFKEQTYCEWINAQIKELNYSKQIKKDKINISSIYL